MQRISAYVPCFNNAATLKRAVESIRNQTYPVDEILVIDDASTDSSPEIASSLSVELVPLPAHSGRGAARACAMERARNDLVLSLDASKELPVAFLERAMTWLEDTRVAAVFGRIEPATNSTAVDRWSARHLFKSREVHQLDRKASLITAGALVRKPAVLQAGNFDRSMIQAEDRDLGRRLLALGYDVIFDPELSARCLTSDTLCKALERYWRWNFLPEHAISAGDYVRQVVYSIKVMAARDLAAGEPASALISLICPHYLLWRALTFKVRIHSRTSPQCHSEPSKARRRISDRDAPP
ncbi:MAG TPA: glycosyltransferase family 2 protein [Candidatus Obscuribacterales bacterium]